MLDAINRDELFDSPTFHFNYIHQRILKKSSRFHQNIKLFSLIIIRNVSQAANHHVQSDF